MRSRLAVFALPLFLGADRSHHLPEDIKFAKAVPSTRGELVIRIAGPAAWTDATSTARGEFNWRAINSAGAESMVLSNGTGGWKIRQIHWSSRTHSASAKQLETPSTSVAGRLPSA